jgi:zinc protease
VVLNPSFPADELDGQRSQYLNAIRQEKTRPVSIALRLLPELLYGEGHAYARPLSGTGTEKSISAISRDDLERWHGTWFRPGNATLIVAGDTDMEEIAPRIEALFRDWAPGAVPEREVAQAALPEGEVIYLVDRPQAQQSIIFGSQLIVPMSGPDEEAIRAMNDVLGGQFSARINMNLREDKGWSYGARSLISETRAQRPFIAYASVQSDRTADSLAEMRREIREIREQRPPQAEELQRVQRSRTLSLPGRWETNRALLSAQSQIVSFGLPEDYWDVYAERINRLTLEQVRTAAVDTLDPDRLTWVVIGDRALVEPALRELGVGEIRLLDADGRPAGKLAARGR